MMKRDFLTTSKILLVIADVVMVVLSFGLAYYYRIHFDDRPYYFQPQMMNFLFMAITLIPLWVGVNFLSGLYDRSVFLYRSREYGRIFIASVISVMAMISYEFFTGEDIFPVRIIALYFVAINFVSMILGREIIRGINNLLLRLGVGRQRILIIGNSLRTAELAQFFMDNIGYGYDVVGVVAKDSILPSRTSYKTFSKLKDALENVKPDILIQTDLAQSEDIHRYAIEHHLSYMFVPQQDRLLSQLSSVEIVGGLPIIDVKITTLFGVGCFWKRAMDIVFGVIGIIIASPIMLLMMIIMKISEPKGEIFFRQVRLTRHNKEFKIYKFRSNKAAYNGLSPEQAFTKMGKPELIKKYRDNGDQLDNDPRITAIGRFMRATSIDELPQLFNVVKGDISLVGPRALVPKEINQYRKKDIILSVKSGVTGLAQVSGRRDISFEERRQLDVYYVQNWSLLLDIQILFKTVFSVIFRRGAK